MLTSQAAAIDHHQAVRAIVNSERALTLLDIGTEQVWVSVSSRAGDVQALGLEIGTERTAREHLHHSPPRRAEFEMVIEPIEDEITRLVPRLPANSLLLTDDAAVRAIASMAGKGGTERITLHLSDIEQVFARLAAMVMGQPASVAGVPQDNAFAIRLIVLREFLHHLGFEEITVL